MENLFSIGEVSKIKNISIKTLRYYHKIGILIPIYIDESNGYRYYTSQQFIHIDIIKGCRNLGTSIKELQSIFQLSSTNELINFMEIKKTEALTTINKLNQIITNIEQLKNSIQKSKKLSNDPSIKIENFAERVAIAVPYKKEKNTCELIYYSNLNRRLDTYNFNSLYDRGTFYDSNSKFYKNPLYIFAILPNNYKKSKLNNLDDILIFPKGKYITMYFNTNTQKEQFKKLQIYLKKQNIVPSIILEIDLLNDIFDTNFYNSQIQIFISEI